MSMVKWYVSCLMGPRLYYLYFQEMTEYVPNRAERWSDKPIRIVSRFWPLFLLIMPISILVPICGFLVPVSLLVLSFLFLLRGVGRYRNAVYRKFISDVELDIEQCQEKLKYESTNYYDFDVSVLPHLFHQNQSKLVPKTPKITTHTFDRFLASFLSCFVYPGSVRFDLYRSSKVYAESRYKLISAYSAHRIRLKCNSRQTIDCMYANPNNTTENKLVISCKGNYSFYESRGMSQWLSRGPAVLGWNHCGCGYSTGSPTGKQEKESILTVVSYSVQILGFPLENIVLYGNSIGGFTACFAVASFPNIGGILLEATFDDINNLIPALIPRFLPRRLIQYILRYCYDLNNIEYLMAYNGPVTLIRKTDDVLMRSNRNELGSNRSNFILIRLIKQRYGHVFMNEDSLEGVNRWMSVDSNERFQIERKLDHRLFRRYFENFNLSQTEELSETSKQDLAVFIATQFMKNQKAPHSSNLSSNLVKIPKHIPWNN